MLKVVVLPEQNADAPEKFGTTFVLCVTCFEAVAVQLFASVTVTVNTPDADGEIVCVVAPLLHAHAV